MTSTVRSLFDAAELHVGPPVVWGTRLTEVSTGVYVVALTPDPDSMAGARSEAGVSRSAVERLLQVRPKLTVDGAPPTAEELAARPSSFWVPDEVVLYVGRTGQSLRKRVRAFYSSRLGARTPHARGRWLKTLADLERLWVYAVETPDYVAAEATMLDSFSVEARRASGRTANSDLLLPFANLEDGRKRRKPHGIRGATGRLPPAR